jgi:hypothetical protein
MIRKLVLAVALATTALPVFAAAEGFVDAYYIPYSRIKAVGADASVDGDGFGAHVHFPLAEVFVITGEFQRHSYDEVQVGPATGEIDFTDNQLRVGFGAQSTPDVLRGTVYADYIRLMPEDGEDSDGFGLHARVSANLLKPLNLFAEIGYVRVEEEGETFDGPEFLVGGAWKFTELIGAFADYRISRFDGNGDSEGGARFYDVRTGVRLHFQP